MIVHKIREALAEHRKNDFLQGKIHIDGTYVHSVPRLPNKKADRVDRRKPEHTNPNKRAVLVMRERYSEEERHSSNAIGAKRTLTFPIKSESLVDYDLKRVNHQVEFLQ